MHIGIVKFPARMIQCLRCTKNTFFSLINSSLIVFYIAGKPIKVHLNIFVFRFKSGSVCSCIVANYCVRHTVALYTVSAHF